MMIGPIFGGFFADMFNVSTALYILSAILVCYSIALRFLKGETKRPNIKIIYRIIAL